MLSIGDFSQLGQVSIRTLRLYDELELLNPARVDAFTGYRYYSVDQLPRLNRILMLKDLGLSLEQIADLLEKNLPADQLRTLLMRKKVEIQHELYESRSRLERVEARLQQIEQESLLTTYDVVLKTAEPLKIYSVRQLVPSINDMPQMRSMMFGDLYTWLAEKRIKAPGPELAIYHNSEYTEQNIDMEAAIIVDKFHTAHDKLIIDPNQHVALRELPGSQMVASVIHYGQPKHVGQAIVALYTWIEQNHYATNGCYREIHLYGKEMELKTYDPVTIEMQIPVVTNLYGRAA